MVLYNFFFFFFFAPLLLRNGYYCKAYALKSDEERNRGGRKDFIIESIGGITSWWRHEKTDRWTHEANAVEENAEAGFRAKRSARNTVAYRWWVNDVITINLTSNRFDEGTLFSPVDCGGWNRNYSLTKIYNFRSNHHRTGHQLYHHHHRPLTPLPSSYV